MSTALIYELADGKPIYYNGYKDVLNGKRPIETLLGRFSTSNFNCQNSSLAT